MAYAEWNTSVPTTGTKIVNIPSVHSKNWYAFQYTLEEEHYGFSSPLSGRHMLGRTTMVSAAPSATILGIAAPFTGAMGWDTDSGQGWLYDGDAWVVWSELPNSRVFAYIGTNQTIPETLDNCDSITGWQTTNTCACTISSDTSQKWEGSASIKVILAPAETSEFMAFETYTTCAVAGQAYPTWFAQQFETPEAAEVNFNKASIYIARNTFTEIPMAFYYIYTDNGATGGDAGPETMIASGTKTMSWSSSYTYEWKECTFTTVSTGSSGTKYWLVINDPNLVLEEHYIAIDGDEGYTDGIYKLGTTFANMATAAADMAFRIEASTGRDDFYVYKDLVPYKDFTGLGNYNSYVKSDTNTGSSVIAHAFGKYSIDENTRSLTITQTANWEEFRSTIGEIPYYSIAHIGYHITATNSGNIWFDFITVGDFSGSKATVEFDTESLDSLGEWDASTYTFTACADGYYELLSSLTLSGYGGTEVSTYFVVSNIGSEPVTAGKSEMIALSDDSFTITSNTIAKVVSGGTVNLQIAQDCPIIFTILSGEDKSFLKIHKLS